jgi:hypothetical protein
MLRQHFPTMPGRPAVLVATHPTKHADETNLLPRGGGAFLNEVDGNLCRWADAEQAGTSLHWQGKFRGMTFIPIQFDLRPCPHPSGRCNGDPVMVKLAGQPMIRRWVTCRRGKRSRQTSQHEKATIACKILADPLVTEGKIAWHQLVSQPSQRRGGAPSSTPAPASERTNQTPS